MDSDAVSQYSSPSRRAQRAGTGSGPPTLAYCLLYGARAVLLIRGPGFALFVLDEVNLQLESRVREIRQHGSEGGGAGITGSPYPYTASSSDFPRSRVPAFLLSCIPAFRPSGLNIDGTP